ncbi:MAG TPA: NmrA/HSCARG family protein [Myxococcaceae bacterium]|nr:NmrA/HSCARG family protein [Myxococcaceae bacterium]
MVGDLGPFLVIGATGRQGGATARALRRRGANVRALVRNPDHPAARALAGEGTELAVGDLDDVGSLVAAMAGARGAFSVQNWWQTGAKREVRQGKNVADAAKKARLPHLLYSSVGGADRNAEITHWRTKWEIELYIRELGLPATILRPVTFMETYYAPPVEKGILGGKLVDPIRAERRVQLIATDDIGEWAALALTQPGRFIGKELEIAGDELTNPEIAATFARVMGRPVRFQRLPLFVTRLVLGKEFHQMFKWFNEQGYRADLPLLRREYPDVELTSLEAWLGREGWRTKGTSYARHEKTFIAKIPRDE